MKKTLRFAALFLAVLITVTALAAAVLAENEEPSAGESTSASEPSQDSSGDDSSEDSSEDSSGDPDVYTVGIKLSGNAEVYFNGKRFDGSVYSSSADGDSALSVKVVPSADSELVSVYRGNTKEPIVNGECSFSFIPEAGKSYELTVNAKTVPKKVSVSVETKGVSSYKLYVGDAEATDIYTGDKVRVQFEVPDEFDASKATLTLNGAVQTVTSSSFEFTAEGNTEIVMLYGVVPVKFVIVGAGMLSVSDIGDIRNNSNGTVEKTVYLTKNGQYNLTATPALNYVLSGIVEISEPNRAEENGVYYFRPSGPTTVTARFKSSGSQPPVSNTHTVSVNAGTGGTVTAGGQTVIGGTGTKIDLIEGESLVFTVTPDEGYVIDVFRVGGTAVTLDGNTYTLLSIASDITVSALFKSEIPPVADVKITADDIEWGAERTVVDISGGKRVMRDVFDRIASLAGENRFVEFRSEGGTLYIPYGGAFGGEFESADLSVTELTSGALFESIKNAVSAASEAEIVYKTFSFNTGIELPEGTMVSFNLGEQFSGSSAVMLLFDSANAKFFTKDNADAAVSVSADGVSGRYFYDNEGVVICSKSIPGEFVIEASVVNYGGTITPSGATRVSLNSDCSFLITAYDGFSIKQILIDDQPLEGVEGLSKYTHVFERVGVNHTIKVEFFENGEPSGTSADKGGSGTVLVVIIVIIVAVAGAAALFIVKWRQERF